MRRRLTVAHNVREQQPDGTSRTRPVELVPLGAAEAVDAEAAARVADALAVAWASFQAAQAAAGHPASVRLNIEGFKASLQPAAAVVQALASRRLGMRILCEGLWMRLGLDELFRNFATEHCTKVPFERILFAMVVNRLVDPLSKLACNDWVADTAWFPEATVEGSPWTVDQFYRVIELLGQHEEEIMALLHEKVWALASADARAFLLVDASTTYTECARDDDTTAEVARAWIDHELRGGPRPEEPLPQTVNSPSFRMRGHSKDHRADAPQVGFCLGVLGSGLPVWQVEYPGNEAEKVHAVTVVEAVLGRHPEQALTVVMDTGLGGRPNLRKIADYPGIDWIVGHPVRKSPWVDAILAAPIAWRTVSKGHGDVWEICSMALPTADRAVASREELLVVIRGPERARRDRRKLDRTVQELDERLSRNALAAKDGVPNPLLNVSRFARLLRVGADDRLERDDDAIALEQARCGIRAIRTSHTSGDVGAVLEGYDLLYRVEDRFREYKTPMRLRPMYHRAEVRIRGHMVMSMIALMLRRIAEMEPGRSWDQLSKVFGPIDAVRMQQGGRQWWQRTPMSGDARAILEQLRLTAGPETWSDETSIVGVSA